MASSNLDEMKRLEYQFLKLKELKVLIEECKEKKRSEYASVKHQMNDDGKPSSSSEFPPSSFASLNDKSDPSAVTTSRKRRRPQ
ncbi:hypothetical protein TSUD_338440 [Trifolium subterraneum]|uniref:Uncharacterized protein n=1 Tax=Trifolium subterraneum TaxID=3900 RepID=A0A2Z6LPF2_TRISU|nr:hypothetical protein TSUD_338440 [Trifolium subterraneum]